MASTEMDPNNLSKIIIIALVVVVVVDVKSSNI